VKNFIKLLGITSLVAVIGFGFTSCFDDDNKGAGTKITQIDGEIAPVFRGTYRNGSFNKPFNTSGDVSGFIVDKDTITAPSSLGSITGLSTSGGGYGTDTEEDTVRFAWTYFYKGGDKIGIGMNYAGYGPCIILGDYWTTYDKTYLSFDGAAPDSLDASATNYKGIMEK